MFITRFPGRFLLLWLPVVGFTLPCQLTGQSVCFAQEKPAESKPTAGKPSTGKPADNDSSEKEPSGSKAPEIKTAASVPYPLDAVVTADGAVVVVDRNLPGLWRWKADQLEVLVQGSKRFRQPLNASRCLAVDKTGQIYVACTSTREIYRLDAKNQPQPMTGGAIGLPMDIAFRADGSLMVADLETHSLLRVSADGKKIQSVAKVNPRGVFVDHQDRVWVVSQDPKQLQIIADDGKSTAVVDKPTFEFPHQVVVNSRNEAFVSDSYKKAIWKVVEGSAPEVVVAGPPLDNPVGIALVDDEVVITDPRTRTIYRLQNGKCEPWFEIK